MLENKLHITNAVELVHKEEELSKKNAVTMYETGFLNNLQVETFASLAAIHHRPTSTQLRSLFIAIQCFHKNCATSCCTISLL